MFNPCILIDTIFLIQTNKQKIHVHNDSSAYNTIEKNTCFPQLKKRTCWIYLIQLCTLVAHRCFAVSVDALPCPPGQHDS